MYILKHICDGNTCCNGTKDWTGDYFNTKEEAKEYLDSLLHKKYRKVIFI